MIRPIALCLIAIIFFAGCGSEKSPEQTASAGPVSLRLVQDDNAGTISVFRKGSDKAIVTQNAKSDFRPYLHPLVAPDGKGVLTEYSPGHHKHQTGIYWGFTRVNGRDYFHNPGGDYWRKVSAEILQDTGRVVE